MKKSVCTLVLTVSMVLLFSGCSDKEEDVLRTGMVTVDAMDYAKWVYFDFETGEPEIAPVGGDVPSNWTIAIHRYDIKTNGCKVYATKETSWEAVTVAPADGTKDSEGNMVTYLADTDGKIITDMSGMAGGNVVYADTKLNVVLGSWLRMEGMPPAFVMSNVVYTVLCANGKYAKIKFTDYSNDDDVRGHITFKYEYPLQ